MKSRFSGAVKIGKAAVMTIGTTIRSDEWIEISWSEALAEELPGFELYLVESDDKKTKVKVESIGVGTYETVRLRPEAGWHSGEPYILRLTDKLVDAASVSQRLAVRHRSRELRGESGTDLHYRKIRHSLQCHQNRYL